MKNAMFTIFAAVVLIATVGCGVIQVLGPQEYVGVNLTVVSRTNGAPIGGAEVSTAVPAHRYTTSSNGFTEVYAKFGQDLVTVTVSYWTLPPSEWRTVTRTWGLTNKAVNIRLAVEDDPYRPY